MSQGKSKGKENLYLILLNQRNLFNKIKLGFKSSRSQSKGINMKKLNQMIYKCSSYNKLGHSELFCYKKLRRSKDNIPTPLRATNTLGPKKISILKVKILYIL